MANTLLRWILLPLFGLGYASTSLSQVNLVPNHDFEIYTFCPTNFGQGGTLPCTPWQNGSQGTSDYLNECSNSFNVDVPDNWFGHQDALSGAGYAGIIVRWGAFTWREYLQVQLTQQLTAGLDY